MQHLNWRLGALVIAFTLFASACGQKGDLYKPERTHSHSATTSITHT